MLPRNCPEGRPRVSSIAGSGTYHHEVYQRVFAEDLYTTQYKDQKGNDM